MISNSLAKSGVRKFNLNGFGEFVKCLWRCANGNRGIIWKEKKMNFWNADSWKVEGWRLREPNCRWRMYNNQDANYRRRKWLWRQGSDFVRSLKVDLKKKKRHSVWHGRRGGSNVRWFISTLGSFRARRLMCRFFLHTLKRRARSRHKYIKIKTGKLRRTDANP